LNNIFRVLSLFAILFVLATGCLGFALRNFDIRDVHDAAGQRWATIHRLSGVAAALAVVLVNSIVVTYFVGTSRWCKEVAETYELAPTFVRRSNAIKRRTFPLCVANMLIAVGIVALGGAGDPAGTFRGTPPPGLTWTNVHFMAAAVGLCFVAWASLAQYTNITANQAVITDVMGEVKRIRTEHGLDTEG
jgi:phage FluMu protein Com